MLCSGRETVGEPRDEVFRFRPLPGTALRCRHSCAHVVGPAFSLCDEGVDCLLHRGEQAVRAEALQKPAALELAADEARAMAVATFRCLSSAISAPSVRTPV